MHCQKEHAAFLFDTINKKNICFLVKAFSVYFTIKGNYLKIGSANLIKIWVRDTRSEREEDSFF